MSVEIEMRARFDQAQHDKLIRHLRDHADDLGTNDKHIYFYVLPDKLLKVVNNISVGTAKLSLKTSRIGQGAAFPEIEMEIEIAVKHSAAWGYHAEFETLLEGDPTEAEKAQAIAHIHEVADELDVRLMTEDELGEFTAAFERAQAGGENGRTPDST